MECWVLDEPQTTEAIDRFLGSQDSSQTPWLLDMATEFVDVCWAILEEEGLASDAFEPTDEADTFKVAINASVRAILFATEDAVFEGRRCGVFALLRIAIDP